MPEPFAAEPTAVPPPAVSPQEPDGLLDPAGGAPQPAKDAFASAPRRSRVATTVRAFRHRNFQLFFSGQLISLVGTWMQMVAQSWLIYRLTKSSLLLGSVGFASQLPVFLIAPFGGVIADRHNRHRIIVATQTISMLLAFVLSWLTLSGRVQVWHIFLLAACMGVVNAFDMPTRQAFMVDMVGKEDLMNAIALNSSMFNGARILGPAVAGVLVASIGEGWCFFGNAVSYIAVIVGLLFMKLGPLPMAGRERSPIQHMIEGFAWVKRTRSIRAILLLLAMVSLVGMPYTVLMPIFADQILHRGASGLGILMSATGLGAMLGALTLATRTSVKGLERWIATAAGSFGACMILFASSRIFWLSVAFLVPLGFSMMLQMAASNTLTQAIVPDQLRGRVMSVHAMMFMGMAPFGAGLAGVIAHRVGAPLTVGIGGVACVLASLLFAVRMKGFRSEAYELIVAQQFAGGEPTEEMNAPAFRDN